MNGQSSEGETFLTRQVSGNKADCRNKAASLNLQVLGCKIQVIALSIFWLIKLIMYFLDV